MNAVALVALLLVIVCCALSGCMGISPTAPASNDVVIGVLIPLTGDSSVQGQTYLAAITLAAQDSNRHLASGGSPQQIRLIVEDTATDPAVTLEKTKKLYDAGVRIVVGPVTSAEITHVKGWADQHGMVLIGYASTSPELSITGDNVYRVVPDDTRQGEAMAAFMNRSGVRVVIPVVRNDTWGTNLHTATKTRFENIGGTVNPGYLYEPGTRAYAPLLRNLSLAVTAAQQQYGTSAVGVYAIGFDELVPLFAAAGDDPVLVSVPWFGSDGTAKTDALLQNRSAARFAARTGFADPVYGAEADSPSIANITQRIQALTGSEPDGYALAAYDATVIASRSALNARDVTFDQRKRAVELTADYYYGLTGYTRFVTSGDRAYAVYPFWAVKDRNGTYAWEKIAIYTCPPDQPGRFT
ncbi:MAG: penicillin-binding protein activator [Methanoregula sp.]|jgi:branched-chain amino acid transport system substrate-binding protein